ncbi:MAG: hypothetical protein AVDCRST_MAG54-1155, partial [uncultured Actinomycetospora sp.]
AHRRRPRRDRAGHPSLRPGSRPVRSGGGAVGVHRRRGVGRDRRGAGPLRGPRAGARVLRARRRLDGRAVPPHDQPRRRVRRRRPRPRHQLRARRGPHDDGGVDQGGGVQRRHLPAHGGSLEDRESGDHTADHPADGGVRGV